MATLYALNMNFDPAATTGMFQPYDADNKSGRVWAQSIGGVWSFAGNPDTYTPVLDLSANDTVQFAVSPSSTPSSAIQSVALTVVFANDRAAVGNPTQIASPFQLSDGNQRCVLSDPPKPYGAWFYIGPYNLAVGSNSGRGRLRFEFFLAARITFADLTVKDYGYDPEMDVDV